MACIGDRRAPGKERHIRALEAARKARQALADKKGVAVVMLDMRRQSGLTDYMLIATGNSAPHLRAMAEEVRRAMAEAGSPCYRYAGTADSGWIVLDLVDVVVHVLSPEMREYYQLEALWSDAPRAE